MCFSMASVNRRHVKLIANVGVPVGESYYKWLYNEESCCLCKHSHGVLNRRSEVAIADVEGRHTRNPTQFVAVYVLACERLTMIS